MKCPLCETGNLKEGTTTVTLERDGAIIVFKNVPAFVCDQCEYAETDEDITAKLLQIANAEAAKGEELRLVRYVA
jgi:YgiT-type zinc finger domain-containing protein